MSGHADKVSGENTETVKAKNPLISDYNSETLSNVSDVAKMLQELIADHQWNNDSPVDDQTEFKVSESAASGIYLVLRCMTQALDHVAKNDEKDSQ